MKYLVTTVGLNPILSVYAYNNENLGEIDKIIYIATMSTRKYIKVLENIIDIDCESFIVDKSDLEKISLSMKELRSKIDPKKNKIYIDLKGATKAISIKVYEEFEDDCEILNFNINNYKVKNIINVVASLNGYSFQYKSTSDNRRIFEEVVFKKEQKRYEIEKIMISKNSIATFNKIENKFDLFRYINGIKDIFGRADIYFENTKKKSDQEDKEISLYKKSLNKLNYKLNEKTKEEFEAIELSEK